MTVRHTKTIKEFTERSLKNSVTGDSGFSFGSVFTLCILSAVLMYIAAARKWGLPFFISGDHAVLMSLVRLALFVPVAYLGRSFYIGGFKSLAEFKPTAESLAALGTGAALVFSFYSLAMISIGAYEYQDGIYFESAAMIISLLAVGRYLEEKSRGRMGEPVKKLYELFPKTATIIRDDKEITVPSESIKAGDLVLIKPGERIPCDGTVISGKTTVDESMMTGEAVPAEKTEGDLVLAGTSGTSGFFTVRAEKSVMNTALYKMIQSVKDAGGSKPSKSRFAERAERIYVTAAVAACIIAFVIRLSVTSDLGQSLSVLVKLLLLSCPCAFGFITPAAVIFAYSKGTKEGVLFKNSESLESFGAVNTVVMDKTGVITVGKPFVSDVIPLGADTAEVIMIAASLESHSSHPIATAVLDYAQQNDIVPMECSVYRSVLGFGVIGKIDDDEVSVGKPSAVFTDENEGYMAVCQVLAENGKTLAAVLKNGVLIGIIGFEDKIRPTGKSGIAALNELGVKTIMVTGDGDSIAERIADEVGVYDYAADVSPDKKAEIISKLKCGGRTVAMIGDSINDAVALAEADIGISIGSGSEIAVESAQIVLVRNDLRDAAKAVKISAKVIKTVKSNLFWAIIYNAIMFPAAASVPYVMSGALSGPLVLCVCMLLSTASIIINSRRIKSMDLN